MIFFSDILYNIMSRDLVDILITQKTGQIFKRVFWLKFVSQYTVFLVEKPLNQNILVKLNGIEMDVNVYIKKKRRN